MDAPSHLMEKHIILHLWSINSLFIYTLIISCFISVNLENKITAWIWKNRSYRSWLFIICTPGNRLQCNKNQCVKASLRKCTQKRPQENVSHFFSLPCVNRSCCILGRDPQASIIQCQGIRGQEPNFKGSSFVLEIWFYELCLAQLFNNSKQEKQF